MNRQVIFVLNIFIAISVVLSISFKPVTGKLLEIPPRPDTLQEDTVSKKITSTEKKPKKDKNLPERRFKRKERIVESPEYVVLPGDKLFYNLEGQYWGGTRNVTEEGVLSLRYVGRIRIAGKRLGKIKEILSNRLEKYFHKPSLEVKVKTNRRLNNHKNVLSKSIYVSGEVHEPGLMTVNSSRSLREVIESFGGFSKDAMKYSVRVLRAEGGLDRVSVDSTQLTSTSNQKIMVQPGDYVYVPQSRETKEVSDEIFFAGAVKQPKQVRIQEPVTVGVALSKATGGFKSNANQQELLITRANGETHTVNARKQLAFGELSQSERIYIHPGDYVYVPGAESQQVSVTVLGQVGSPQHVNLGADQGVMDAVVKAGLFGAYSELEQIHIFRKANGETQVLSASYNRYVQGDLSQNLSLKDEDVVYVGTKFFPRIETLEEVLSRFGLGLGAVRQVDGLRNIGE